MCYIRTFSILFLYHAPFTHTAFLSHIWNTVSGVHFFRHFELYTVREEKERERERIKKNYVHTFFFFCRSLCVCNE